MGILGDIAGAVGSFFGSSGGSATSDLIKAGTTLGGYVLSSNANKDAAAQEAQGTTQGAQISSDAAIKAAQIEADAAKYAADLAYKGGQDARTEYQAAADRGITAINSGLDDYMKYVEPLLAPRTDVTMPVPQEAPPGRLSPAQQIAEQDLLRNTTSALAASGLRGAGRAGQAVLADADRRFLAGAYDTNQQRQDVAYGRAADNLQRIQAERDRQDAIAQQIGGTQADTGRQIANVETGAGNQSGAALQTAANAGAQQVAAAGRAQGAGVSTAGNLTGQATANAADTQAQAALANSELLNRTIGQIGSIFANDNQDKYKAPEAAGSRSRV